MTTTNTSIESTNSKIGEYIAYAAIYAAIIGLCLTSVTIWI